jgi:hypothetical protein
MDAYLLRPGCLAVLGGKDAKTCAAPFCCHAYKESVQGAEPGRLCLSRSCCYCCSLHDACSTRSMRVAHIANDTPTGLLSLCAQLSPQDDRRNGCREALALALQRLLEEDLYFCTTLYANWQRDDALAILEPVLFGALPALGPSSRAWSAQAFCATCRARRAPRCIARVRLLARLPSRAVAAHSATWNAHALASYSYVYVAMQYRAAQGLCQTGRRVARYSASAAAAWRERAATAVCSAGHRAPRVGVRPGAHARGLRGGRGATRRERRPVPDRRVARRTASSSLPSSRCRCPLPRVPCLGCCLLLTASAVPAPRGRAALSPGSARPPAQASARCSGGNGAGVTYAYGCFAGTFGGNCTRYIVTSVQSSGIWYIWARPQSEICS